MYKSICCKISSGELDTSNIWIYLRAHQLSDALAQWMQINFAPAYFASGQNVCVCTLHLSGYWHNIHRTAFLKVRGFLISNDHRKRAFTRNLKILQFSAKHSLRNSPLQTCSRNIYMVNIRLRPFLPIRIQDRSISTRWWKNISPENIISPHTHVLPRTKLFQTYQQLFRLHTIFIVNYRGKW